MKPTEAVDLARYLRAHFPQQPVDEFTADALGETLAAYPANDCRQAVLNIAERGEQWCSPTAVKAEVKRIREKRVADYGPIEPPAGLDPDEVGGYQRWLEVKVRAIADGAVRPIELEWTGPQHDVIRELGHVGHVVPPVDHSAHAENAREQIRAQRRRDALKDEGTT